MTEWVRRFQAECREAQSELTSPTISPRWKQRIAATLYMLSTAGRCLLLSPVRMVHVQNVEGLLDELDEIREDGRSTANRDRDFLRRELAEELMRSVRAFAS